MYDHLLGSKPNTNQIYHLSLTLIVIHIIYWPMIDDEKKLIGFHHVIRYTYLLRIAYILQLVNLVFMMENPSLTSNVTVTI